MKEIIFFIKLSSNVLLPRELPQKAKNNTIIQNNIPIIAAHNGGDHGFSCADDGMLLLDGDGDDMNSVSLSLLYTISIYLSICLSVYIYITYYIIIITYL